MPHDEPRIEQDVLCSNCGEYTSTVGKTHGNGMYFLDYYCSKCWKAFREGHSRICKKCEQPVYRCCC